MRSVIAFACACDTLIGTVDAAAGTTGVLIVSGGNEIRCGPHRGMALLAASLSAKGVPVFRYDRRGVGDSAGTNGGWASAAPDLAAAVAAFRAAQPQVTWIVGFGNCDGATTLALFGRAAGVARVVLANPWLGDEADALPPAAAIRARYRERLRDPRTWVRLLRGGVDFRKLMKGLRKVSATEREESDLAMQVIAVIHGWGKNATLLLARGDATAIGFATATAAEGWRVETVDTASHSFAGRSDAIEKAILHSIG